MSLDNQTHLEATPPDLHREDAHDDRLGAVRAVPFFCDGSWHFEQYTDAFID